MTSRSARLLLACLATFAASCINRDLRPLNPCLTSGVRKSLSVSAVDKVDLLFVVDNSSSMREEQASLAQEFPRIIQGLVSGNPDGMGAAEFPPVTSLRVAVVSSDMGVNGVGTGNGEPTVPACGAAGSGVNAFKAHYGDDGRFNHAPLGQEEVADATDCDGNADAMPDTLTTATLPTFLTFDPGGTLNQMDFANRIGCYAILGINGCGFEQQLESMLKSITPSDSDIRFHADSPESVETGGQLDRENAGWLRPEALLAVLMVTDEDDCSSPDGLVFNFKAGGDYSDTPDTGAQAGTRCVRFGDEPLAGNPNDDSLPSLLHPTRRYSDGLIAAKDGDPSKVVFALITGVPVNTVDGSNPEGTNDGVGNLNEILDPAATPSMAIVLTNGGTGNVANGGIQPSCTRCAFGKAPAVCALGFNDLDGDGVQDPQCIDMGGGTAGQCDPGEAFNCVAGNGPDGICDLSDTEVAIQRAFPPRRLVSAARDMQEDGVSVIVQSICQDTFTTAVTAILTKISEALNGSCLPNKLNRAANDQVNCEVVEVLPVGSTCAQFEAQGRTFRLNEETSMMGVTREACTVAQVAVDAATRAGNDPPPASAGAGWYYDDFTGDATACGSRPQRISFTTGADPIVGSTLRLECAQTVLGDLDGPDVGEPCTQVGNECQMTQDQLDIFVVRYNLAGQYEVPQGPLICQSVTNTCQVACSTDADCPGGYVCFTEDEGNTGTPFCADPTCQQ